MTDDSKKPKSSTGKRKFHSKSRNGCSTCKRRRVKCDETRPVCKKCTNLQLECGYATDPPSPKRHKHEEEEEEVEAPVQRQKVEKERKRSGSNRSSKSYAKSASSSPAASSNSGTSASEISDVEKKPDLGGIDLPNAAQILGQGVGRGGTGQGVGGIGGGMGPGIGGIGVGMGSGIGGGMGGSSGPNGAAAAAANAMTAASTMNSLLNAGNLNNINLSHLVNSLTELGGDLSSLGNLASLSNLATLAQLPIDISNLGTLIDTQLYKDKEPIPDMNIPTPHHTQPSSSSSQPQNHPHPSQHYDNGKLPNISANISSSFTDPMASAMGSSNLNMLDLRLMFHYTSQVASTITGAGISDTNIWNYDIPMLAFDHPFLMHSILAFSATHLSRTEKGLDQCVTYHRGDALRLLREAVLDINADNTDALVASALILIMDSLANASLPSSTSPKSLPASAWIFHVKGAATILTAVWPLTETSRFYKFISVDLGDLGDIINQQVNLKKESLSSDQMYLTDLECHDADIADLFPVAIDSPYLVTLAYLNKLHKERYKSDFILRIFAFPALLDKQFLSLLMSGDIKAMRIMRSYYKLLRAFTSEMRDKVWFLEGVSNILPVDVEEYAGGAGGMHMMLDFLGGGPSIVDNEIDEEIAKFERNNMTHKLVDTNNLPSDITSDLEIMQSSDTFMNIK